VIKSISEISLDPVPGKKIWNSPIPHEEDIIYFLLVDRFHDGGDREICATDGRSAGFGSPEELNSFYGGNLKGIISKLDYISGMGVTAIGLSPVLENNPSGYHGYATQNYLNIDPHFGTKEDLQLLIQKAHNLGLKVYLDVVINHSGDNWYYKRMLRPCYSKGRKYTFGGWNSETYPLPQELRNEKYYRKEGMIRNWDSYPETVSGDFFILKKFKLDDSAEGKELLDILTKIYCWWIRETDCDGFRIDALKHLGKDAAEAFCKSVREFCTKNGKTSFLIFGELILGDEKANDFLRAENPDGSGTGKDGVDTIFDFPLHFTLPAIVKETELPVKLRERFDQLELACGKRASSGKKLITFLDNHDQVGQQIKERSGAGLTFTQFEAALGIMFCLPGIPSLYYGTEQWLTGSGPGDQYIREAMFCRQNEKCLHNPDHSVYKIVNRLSNLRKENPVLRTGQLIFNETSERGAPFSLRNSGKVVVFTRIEKDSQLLVLYNADSKESIHLMVRIVLPVRSLRCIYGRQDEVRVQKAMERKREVHYFKIELQPSEFVILK
jgi:glycosidase